MFFLLDLAQCFGNQGLLHRDKINRCITVHFSVTSSCLVGQNEPQVSDPSDPQSIECIFSVWASAEMVEKKTFLALVLDQEGCARVCMCVCVCGCARVRVCVYGCVCV